MTYGNLPRMAKSTFRRWLTDSFATQGEAARAFNVDQSTISNWVTGRRRPSIESARKMVRLSRGKLSLEGIYGSP